MTRKLSSLLAGVAVLALAGAAQAGEPLKLTNVQMDKVAAGSTAVANATAGALGELLADTLTQTNTSIDRSAPTGSQFVVALGQAQALAAGGVVFGVAASVQSQAIATW
jgi:hypothetical protein